MTFSYNNLVPATNNNPSVDQPDMLINTQSIDSIVNVDHVSFNAASGGTHKQVTFSSKNAAGAQVDPQSVLFTGSGTASTVSQMFYKTQNATMQISAVRAWAFCDGAGGILASQSSNVTSVTGSGGNYNITLSANAVSSANFAVICSSTAAAVGGDRLIAFYGITGVGTFALQTSKTDGTLKAPTSFSFIVLQI